MQKTRMQLLTSALQMTMGNWPLLTVGRAL